PRGAIAEVARTRIAAAHRRAADPGPAVAARSRPDGVRHNWSPAIGIVDAAETLAAGCGPCVRGPWVRRAYSPLLAKRLEEGVMTIVLDHTIVPAHDKIGSARFFARIFGLDYAGPISHFAPVKVNDALTLDFDERGQFESHHYAFKVGEPEFD